uniref:latex serine proteinase inhibitor-like n=1 Tax=Erigeron canadensis TaxID=72917 RepID=UPI001CB97816|nr:latex serine proteinase inhibitor-like [Erigeron canadensis]
MKPSIFSYVLFLLFALTTQSIFIFTTTNSASAAEVVVKDSTGKKVLNNVRYHVSPVAKGGSIKLTDTINKKKVCPFEVVHDPKDNVGGEFMFTMITDKEVKENYLKTERILGIDSGYPKGACTESTFWTINDAEAKGPPANLITTGGGFETEETCFQVVENPKPTSAKVHSYMLQHCPGFCGGPDKTCFNISLSSYQGVNRLSAVGATPFEFAFHKIAK